MNKKSFDDFVNEQTDPANGGETHIDRAKRISEWKQDLDALYTTVESFLAPYVKNKKIELRYSKKKIHEELLGSYEARVLSVLIGSTRVRLEPIGTLVIGSKGRVDMVGPMGTARLVLVQKGLSAPKITVQVWTGIKKPPITKSLESITDWEWKIATRPPRITYTDLTADAFYAALMEVVNG